METNFCLLLTEIPGTLVSQNIIKISIWPRDRKTNFLSIWLGLKLSKNADSDTLSICPVCLLRFLLLTISKIHNSIVDPQAIVRVRSIDPWQIILRRGGVASRSASRTANRSHTSLFIKWGSWPVTNEEFAPFSERHCEICFKKSRIEKLLFKIIRYNNLLTNQKNI